MGALMTCRNVTKKWEHFTLDGISFDLEPGYIMGVIGRNGTGKSTLLQTLMGSLKMDCMDGGEEGTRGLGMDAQIDGVSIFKDSKGYKAQFAYVLHETPFFQGGGALENGMVYGSYYKGFDLEKYKKLLEEFDIPPKRSLARLSDGQQIRQQLAFALSYDAKVYFLDEPTGNLDVGFRDTFYRYIREIVSDGKRSVIYASHLVEELEEFADYILWMEGVTEPGGGKSGRVRYMGTAESLINSYRIVDPEALPGGMGQIPKEWIEGGRHTESSEEILVRLPSDGEEALKKQICVAGRYGGLKEIMYYVEKGEIL